MGSAGKTVLITGASRGIGAELATSFAIAGYRVALSARDRGALVEVARCLPNDPIVLTADLGDEQAPAILAAAAVAALGHIDVLVNNAGVVARGRTAGITAPFVDHVLGVNVRAPLLLIAALIPHMSERGGGSIINFSSVSGVVGTPHRAVYAASKGAIDAATRSLAIELGPAGIRVNAVAPGVVTTDAWSANRAVPGVIEDIAKQIPLGRWSTPGDVAEAVLFLASDAARYITGETLRVDGGMASTRDLFSGIARD
jgi:NAD(P)-dependent dehydrogenase (short-subunit alcohol dehydrogenase family)